MVPISYPSFLLMMFLNHPEMKDLSVRTLKCDCGLVINRDQNAAINILHEGLRMLDRSFETA